MQILRSDVQARVHCRTGSLEIMRKAIPELFDVHCRTGSLEKLEGKIFLYTVLHAL